MLESLLQLFVPQEIGIRLEEVAEGLHSVCLGEGIGALLHQPELGPDSSDVLGHREVYDGAQELGSWLDSFTVPRANGCRMYSYETALLHFGN